MFATRTVTKAAYLSHTWLDFVQLEKLEKEQKAIEAEEAKTMATRKGKDKAKRSGR